MNKVRAELVDTGHVFQSRAFLNSVRYEAAKLIVSVMSPGDGAVASAVFSEVIGFRVLDEGDLNEFWPDCAADNGWLFRIRAGGWFDQEVSRPGFLHEKIPGLDEYFVAGQNDCISVLAGEAPRVEITAI